MKRQGMPLGIGRQKERLDRERRYRPEYMTSEGNNLLIKGNNLLALHSLKARYAGGPFPFSTLASLPGLEKVSPHHWGKKSRKADQFENIR